MKVVKTGLEGVCVIEPDTFRDGRGSFSETFSHRKFAEKVCDTIFVQDNESRSRYGVLRGLHYQLPPMAQSKLVRVVRGAIMDMAVDIRKGSPTFGKYFSYRLDERNAHQLFIPRGFAHGFVALEEDTVVAYKCDNHYSPGHEGTIAWNDPAIAIDWCVPADHLIISDRDAKALPLNQVRVFDYGEKLY